MGRYGRYQRSASALSMGIDYTPENQHSLPLKIGLKESSLPSTDFHGQAISFREGLLLLLILNPSVPQFFLFCEAYRNIRVRGLFVPGKKRLVVCYSRKPGLYGIPTRYVLRDSTTNHGLYQWQRTSCALHIMENCESDHVLRTVKHFPTCSTFMSPNVIVSNYLSSFHFFHETSFGKIW